MKLFRDEVHAARSARWLGSVRLAQSVPFWLASIVAMILASSLLAYGVLGSYTRKAHISGILEPTAGDVSVETAVGGRVAHAHVKEGQPVAAGDILFVVDTNTPAEGRVDVSDTTSLLEPQYEVLGGSRLNEREQIVSVQRENAAGRANPSTNVQRGLPGFNQKLDANPARRPEIVVAPCAGVISSIRTGSGRFVSQGQKLADIRANAPLEAHLFAPSRAIGFVAPGQRVMLRFAAYPYQKFGLQGGTVRAVSQSPSVSNHQLSTTQVQLGRQSTESIYRVSVTLDSQSINIYGTARPLMAGMALDADIMQDRRSIIEWMFEPLFAAANRSQ